MNTKRFGISVVAVFVFYFVYEFLVHGFLMGGMYKATASVWRPEDPSYMPFFIVGDFLVALALSFIFTRHYEGKGIGEGLRFGVYLGFLLLALQVPKYGYLPIPFSIVAAWMVAGFFKALGCGVVLSLTYKK